MTAVSYWQGVDELMREALATGVFPGAQLLVGCGDDVVLDSVYGVVAEGEAAVTSATRYDISSLTKPLATLSSLLVLISRAVVSLDTLVVDVLPEFGEPALPEASLERNRASVRLRDLLGHCSGLPAHRRYYQSCGTSGADRERICALACREPLEREPRTAAVYSDIGFIVLGAVVERLCGDRLDRFAAQSVFDPLGLEATGFMPVVAEDARGETPASTVAPCGWCQWRGAVVRGVVQDENAYAMNGVAGHAGLFSTAAEVHAIVAHYLRALSGHSSLFAPGLVDACWRLPDGNVPDPTWALGWDTPSPRGSSAGNLVSKRTFGHLGFTGASVWIDVERGAHVIVLSNRVHPDPSNTKIREVRPRLHDAVFAAIAAMD